VGISTRQEPDIMRSPSSRYLALPMAVLGLWGLADRACAEPGYYVVTPYDNEGLLRVDFRYWTVKPQGRTEVLWPELGLGWGVNSRWTTELFLSWVGSAHSATRPDTLNWQNDILLTQGEWPVDLALHTQWVQDQTSPRQQTLEWGPALQTDWGRWRLNGNIFFEQALGPDRSAPTELQYQWRARYRLGPVLGLGAEGFGEVGTWNHWGPKSQQNHRAGPAVAGQWSLENRRSMLVQGAWLWGKTYGRQGHMFSFKATLDY
jgi:hypothetical protein